MKSRYLMPDGAYSGLAAIGEQRKARDKQAALLAMLRLLSGNPDTFAQPSSNKPSVPPSVGGRSSRFNFR